MQRIAVAVIACALMIKCSVAQAQTASEPYSGEIIMRAWSNPEDCNRANAQPLVFSDLLHRYQTLKSSCVAVEGFWSGEALFEKSREARAENSDIAGGLRNDRIGLYARERLFGKHAPPLRRLIIVGRVGECETQWPGAMMVLGYCHYRDGPILLVSQAIEPKN